MKIYNIQYDKHLIITYLYETVGGSAVAADRSIIICCIIYYSGNYNIDILMMMAQYCQYCHGTKL